MRRSRAPALLAGLTVIATAFACTQTATQRTLAGSVQKEVFALEEEWTKALVGRDTTAFRRLTTPGFVYTEDNVVMTQQELIDAVASSPDVVEWAGNEGMKLYDYNPIAVVTGVLVVKGHNSNGPFTNRYRYTDTWLYRNGKWQAIAAQDYLIPK
jgi:hypothetical protein